MRLNKSNLIIEFTQAFIWACVFLLPPIIYFIFFHEWGGVWWTFKAILIFFLPAYIAYLVNYYFLVSKLLYRGKYIMFIIANILLLAISYFRFLYNNGWTTTIPDKIQDEISLKIIAAGYTGFVTLELVFQVIVVMMAVGMRLVIKWNTEKYAIEEEKRRNAEAELTWLKNQLNPHFLFNTFNNISSLTKINPDKAQESIGQLSELLRYALYESNVQKVRLRDEVEFMNNYIDLMTLRCSGNTTIETSFYNFDEGIMISPLLFISLIENAFKHGVSTHHQSFVRMSLDMDGKDLIFICKNSLIEKNTTDYSGSGIGLENMTRRLDLLYPGSYTYKQFIEENSYIAIVRLKNIVSSSKG